MLDILFLSPAPVGSYRIERPTRRPRTCTRLCPSANINRTSDPGREDEIAAKIAALRKHRQRKEQKASEKISTSASDNSTESSDSSGTDIPIPPRELGGQGGLINTDRVNENPEDNTLFGQLPDWKKEEMLQKQMIEAEQFFNSSSNSSTTTNSKKTEAGKEDASDPYKPKVSTWGLFPRPDNISRAYGGGRRIARGGEAVDTEKRRERDEKIAKRLAAYMASRGIDVEKEEEHREEIETALSKADEFMRQSSALKAVTELERVKPLISDRSRLGGRLLLSLALAYDILGRRENARDLYSRLKGNPFDDVATKARQLLQGFTDMEMLRIDDETVRSGGSGGPRVMNFRLPDVNYTTDRRYETVLAPSSQGEKSSTPISPAMSAILAVIMLSPLLIVALLVLARSHH